MMARRERSLGIAIGPDRVVASDFAGNGDRASGERWSYPLHVGEGWAADLTAAFRALRAARPSARVLHIALMPPLAETRLASLPVIDVSRLRPAIARDIEKYFPIVGEPQVVQVSAVGARSPSAFAPHLVSAAAARVVQDVLLAADVAGWTVDSLGTAQLAWAGAARSDSRSNGARARAMIHHAERVDILELSNGDVVRIRRSRPGHVPLDASEGAHVLAASTDEAVTVAARFARVADGQSLWPARTYIERDRRVWRAARRWTITAAALLLTAGAMAWLGASRDLSAVRAERTKIRARVGAALAARDSLASLDVRLGAIRGFTATAPRWSVAIADVARVLPDDASLVALKAAGDTVVLVGDAEHAAPVFTAIADGKVLTGVHADAPIQQQVQNGEVVAERFTIAGRLPRAERASHAAVSAIPPPKRTP